MKRLLSTLAALLFSFIILGGSVQSQTQHAKGAMVYAEWRTNDWYHGRVGDPCGGGYTINFDDGDVKCCATDKIVIDVIPYAGILRQGDRVLAQWTNGKYYPGVIAAIEGDVYRINFNDGDKGGVAITQIRLERNLGVNENAIYLNDGSVVRGEIASQNRTSITVKTKYATMTIEKKNIREIKYK